MSILAPTPITVVEVTGTDRASYLEAVTSQHLIDAAAGDVRGALYLDAHGAPLAVFDVVVREDRFLLLVATAELADEVVRVLGGRTFLSDATFTRTDDEVRSLRGTPDDAVRAILGGDVAPGRASERHGAVVVGREAGADLVGRAPVLDALAGELTGAGVELSDAEGLAAWRVAAGEPDWGREITAPHLPEELGLLPTHVHLAKGCYPGQEAIARMWMLGRPRRRLARVDVDAGVAAGWEAGTGKQRARVTAVADVDGRRAGLAFVPATADVDDRFETEDGAGVTVRSFVGDGLAVPGHDPAVPRRRDRR